MSLEVGDAVLDHLQVFIQRDTQHFSGMEVPAFAENGDDWCAACQQILKLAVVFDVDVASSSAAKCRDARGLPGHISGTLEEFAVTRICLVWPAALDVCNAHLIQLLRDAQFILYAECHTFCLAAIAESGIIYVNSFHLSFLLDTPGPFRLRCHR